MIDTQYSIRATKLPLQLSSAPYKSTLFMQNKPNSKIGKMNATFYSTKAYEKNGALRLSQNSPKQTQFKPNQTQNKANFQKAQNEHKLVSQKGLSKSTLRRLPENKPNTNPISKNAKKNGLLTNDYCQICKDEQE